MFGFPSESYYYSSTHAISTSVVQWQTRITTNTSRISISVAGFHTRYIQNNVNVVRSWVGNQNTGTYAYWSSKYLLSLLRSLHYYWTSISTTRTKESSCFLPPQQLGNSLGHKVEQGGPLTTASVQFPSYRPNAQFPASELYKVEFGWRSEEISTSSNLVAQRTWYKQQQEELTCVIAHLNGTYFLGSNLGRYIGTSNVLSLCPLNIIMGWELNIWEMISEKAMKCNHFTYQHLSSNRICRIYPRRQTMEWDVNEKKNLNRLHTIQHHPPCYSHPYGSLASHMFKTDWGERNFRVFGFIAMLIP